MPTIPADLSYTPEHEWITRDDPAAVGITPHAVHELGDIVFIDLPEVGREYAAGEQCGEIESAKAVSEVYAPVRGTVVEVNETLLAAPESIADDPYGTGWLFRMSVADNETALLDAEGYTALLAG